MFRDTRLVNKLTAHMGKMKQAAIVTAAALTLSACVSDEEYYSFYPTETDAQVAIAQLDAAATSSNPFNAALQKNYKSLAEFILARDNDYRDAVHFARKGLNAANDATVTPETPGFWPVSDSDHKMLESSRASLIAALDNGGRTEEPVLSAKAQTAFDCMVEGLSNQPANDDRCRGDFTSSMAELKKRLNAEKEVKPTEKPAKPQAQQAPAYEKQLYVILFDSGSAAISTNARSTLQKLARELQSYQRVRINVVGHTDKQGDSNFNLKLSQKRANMVARELNNGGMPAAAIRIMWEGESTPAIPTIDGRPEQANRRVVVEVIASKR